MKMTSSTRTSQVASSSLNTSDRSQSTTASREHLLSEENAEVLELYRGDISGAGIEIKELKGRGRGLVASKYLAAGSKILETPSAASVLALQHLPTTCHGCYLTLQDKENLLVSSRSCGTVKAKMSRCSTCKTLYYCSRECQQLDWPSHKHECTALKRLRSMYFKTYPERLKHERDGSDVGWAGADTLRMTARLCWKRKDERARNGGKDSIWWRRISSMESHAKTSSEDVTMQLALQSQHLVHYLSASTPLEPDQDESILQPADISMYGFSGLTDLLHLCSAVKVNAFTLSSPALAPIGVTVSPLLAFINHSCNPNTVVVFPKDGRQITAVAIRPIAPGEEITTSYIDTSVPYANRQNDLLDRYHFRCDCSLCLNMEKNNDWVDPRWCVWHVGCEKKGIGKMPNLETAGIAESVCNTCGIKFEVDAGSLKKVVGKGLKLLHDDERGALDTTAALETLSTLSTSLVTLTPPSSHPTFAILRLHALLLTPSSALRDLELSTSNLALAYSGALNCLTQNHPTIAIILAEWGKSLSVDQFDGEGRDELLKRLKMCVVVLRKAVTAAEIGFGGEGGIVGIEMRALAQACEGELALLKKSC